MKKDLRLKIDLRLISMGLVLHAEVELIPEYLWDFSPELYVNASGKITPYSTLDMLVKTVLYPVGKEVSYTQYID